MIGRLYKANTCLSTLIFLPLISPNFYEIMHAFHSPFFTLICVKMAERIIEIFLPYEGPIIVVFRHHHQGSLRKSGGFTPNGGAKYKGCSNFRPICGYISETVIDRGIVTMEDEYKVVCALSNSAAFDDLSDPEPQFQGHSIV